MSLVSLPVLLAATLAPAQASPASLALAAFVPQGDRFTTRLPTAGLSAVVDRSGAWLRPLSGGDGLRVRLTHLDGVPVDPVAETTVLPCAPVPLVDPMGDCIPAVQRDLGGVTEWWQAVDGGVQQGWVVATGGAELALELALDGAVEVEVADGEAWVVDASGQAWTASAIQAWDATGARLPVRVRAGEAPGLELRVETAGARFPVTVDPVYATAVSTLTTSDPDAFFGISVDGAGDLDGDGYDDLIVGGNRADDFVGKAWVFYGSASGPAATADLELVPPSTGQFGFHVAGLGDVDGDGYPEVGVGAPFSDGRSGRVYVYSGGPTGLDATPHVVSGPVSGGYFGLAFDGGDVNGDGYADLVASSYCYGGCRGRVYVFEGGPAGLAASPATAIDGPTTLSYYGQAVASGGDTDGDGCDDVVVGGYGAASGEGVVDVFLGSASGLGTSPVASVAGSSGDYLGRAVALGGDLDGDGYDDLAYTLGVGMGTVHVAFGGPAGPDLSSPTVYSGGALGASLALRDDSDADGFGELVLGDSSGGAVHIYRGEVGGVASSPSTSLSGSGGAGYFGTALADAGDVNGDGAGDLVVGAPGVGVGGQASVYLGYVDVDGDGLAVADDCDDTDAAVGGPVAGFEDADGDGFGDGTTTVSGCAGAPGFSLDGSDCDDADPAAYPGAPEVVGDGVDQSCDGVEECFVDDDGDGFADAAGTTAASVDATCDGPGLASEDIARTDCDDTDASVHPDATDLPGDGVDQDCDGSDAALDDSGLADTGDDGDTGAGGSSGTGGGDKGAGCSSTGGMLGLTWLATLWAAVLAGGRRQPWARSRR